MWGFLVSQNDGVRFSFLTTIIQEDQDMTKEDIIKPENLVYQKPRLLNDNPMHYCPGCSHGVVHKLIAEVIEEMGMEEKAIGVSPVGCAVFMYNYLDIDCQEAAHGRAPALASAIKDCGRTDWYSLTREMVTWLVSVLLKRSMHSTAVKILQLSSSTMPFMV